MRYLFEYEWLENLKIVTGKMCIKKCKTGAKQWMKKFELIKENITFIKQ